MKAFAFAVVAVAAGLLLIEGVASVTLFVRESLAEGQLFPAESDHARFDDRLGWVNLPNVQRPDQYGPGIALTTNSRGFRGRREIDARVPQGRVRVVCSGDSFTLGYGVGDDDTWPELLARVDRRIEPVNMGQGGYGLDQAYLWYARDGLAIEHRAHVVAFITDDFARMERIRIAGYAKPRLTLQGGELVVTDVPVERASPIGILWAQNGHLLAKLRAVALLRRIVGRDDEGRAAAPSVEAVGPVVVRLFEDLAERHAEAGRALLCVHLPTATDYGGDRATDAWRAHLAAALGARGIPFLDLVAAFRALSYDEAAALFQGADETHDLRDAAHYSARGNRFVAEAICAALARQVEELAPRE